MTEVDDPFDLERFVSAQDDGGTYGQASAELRAGRKASHWMWFVFPQIAGLGSSPTARHYALTGIDEASAYLAHPVLGPRLHECTSIVLATEGQGAVEVLGDVDAAKLRSSMTLFLRAAPTEPCFQAVLDLWFEGAADPATDELLAAAQAEGRS